ncbi:MAG: UDP-3-O-(3-hydroxymyristoyl)glucosamine N-acyltransferase [Bacteroides sp.]|nr:UDP-3-O-(3-hydroxymyristoyl)glucosamine N-acyltransferase [Bacteroides sp.]
MELSANQIAALVSGRVEGDGEVLIHEFAKIEEGQPGAISFLANPKYTPHIYTTRSSAVLVRNDFEPEAPVSATLIRVEDPYATVAHLLTLAQQMMASSPVGIEQPSFIAEGVEIPSDIYIGAFAYIGKGSVIGKGARIYPQVYIGENCSVGEGSILYPGVKVYAGCKIGANCILHSGVVIGGDGFGFAPDGDSYTKIPQIGNVVIGNDVEIGANTTVDRATMGSTRIADGVKLDNLIQIAHNVEIGRSTVMAAQAGVAGSTKIGAHCMIGGQVGLAGHIHVGDRAQIAAQSGTQKNVPDDARLFGTPAMDLREYGKQAVYVRRLPDLFAQVRDMDRHIKGTRK